MSLPYPNIDPVLLKIGPFSLRWYSLAYIGGLAVGWWYLARLIARPAPWGPGGAPVTRRQLDDVIFWVAIGVMAGGRLGYLLFYEPQLFLAPWEKLFGVIPFPPALATWNGGMSFHGGLLGVAIAGIWFARRHSINMLSLGDMFACAAPIGLFFGRIANFINGELYGRPWDGPWSMVFPSDPLGVPRHPSQLYEAALEGVALFAITFLASRRFGLLKRPGAVMGLFLAGYACSRIFVENFRQPDDIDTLPVFPFGMTMGMVLSLPMLALGAWLVWRAFAPKTQSAQ